MRLTSLLIASGQDAASLLAPATRTIHLSHSQAAPPPSLAHPAIAATVVELRVKDFNITRRGGVIYREDAYLSRAARRFIEILKATAKEIAAERP